MGEYENKSLNMKNYGLLPSLARLINASSYAEKEPSIDGDFRKFDKFMANNQVFLVAKDHPEHAQHCINESLLDDIIKGKQKRVFEYNFTVEDKQKAELFKDMEAEIKRVLDFKGIGF